MFQTFLRAESGRWGFSFARRTRGKGFLSIKANPAKTRGIVEIDRGWSGIFLFPRTNSIVSFISLDETREFTLRTATIFVLKRDTRMQMLVETVSFYFRMENFINFLFFLFCWNDMNCELRRRIIYICEYYLRRIGPTGSFQRSVMQKYNSSCYVYANCI